MQSGLTCSNNFTRDFMNTAFPPTYMASYNINQQASIPLTFQGNNSFVNIQQGQTIRLTLQSTGAKGSYLALNYNGKITGNYTNSSYVQMLAYNNRLQNVFDVSANQVVLLPQS